MRRAIRLQTPVDWPICGSGTVRSEQMVSRLDHRLRLDGDKPVVGTVSVTRVVHAVAAAQDNATRAEGTVALGTRRAEQCDDRNAQSRGQMHGPGISADEETGAAREGNQFADGALQREYTSSAPLANGCGKFFFSRTLVDYDCHSSVGQHTSHHREGFCWPALGSPTSAGIQDGQRLTVKLSDKVLGPGLMHGVLRKWRLDVLQRFACDRRCDGQRVLDY